jgi:hypothetical protein
MNSEDKVRAALRESKRLNGDLMKGEEASVETKDENTARLPRVVLDLRIPLPWLLGGAGVLLWGLISMYFTLLDVSRNVTQMQIELRSATSSAMQLTSDQAMLKYRVEKLEADRHSPPK